MMVLAVLSMFPSAQHSVTIRNHKNSALYKSSNKMLLFKFYSLGFTIPFSKKESHLKILVAKIGKVNSF